MRPVSIKHPQTTQAIKAVVIRVDTQVIKVVVLMGNMVDLDRDLTLVAIRRMEIVIRIRLSRLKA